MADEGSNVDDETTNAKVIAWLEKLLDGKVVSWTRQPRWRPMWFVDIDRAGTVERVVVRGERSDTPLVFPLEHEMLFQQQLYDHGIPVPEVYGWCEDPRAWRRYKALMGPEGSAMAARHTMQPFGRSQLP